MATATPSPLLRYLHHLAVGGTAGDVPDGALLDLYVRRRDESAFAALVRRHGPMVLGVCRRGLRDEHAAEDAVQTTFLVLARKAGSLRQSGSLGPWLHEVARRTARRARCDAVRRRTREAKAAIPVAVEDIDDLVWRDLRPLLDDAVAALGEKYRVPFIRCYLEGETVAETARQLDCPKGTIAVRLARAREQVRARLMRRGISLSLAALTAALANREALAAALTPELGKTILAATASAREVVGLAKVAGWTKGVAMMMAKAKGKMAALLVLSFSAASGGVALFVQPTPAEQRTAEFQPGAEPITPNTKGKLIQKVYQVMDLVVVTGDEDPEHPKQRKANGDEKLIRFILENIAPESWMERGGRATIDFHPLTSALVVVQTPEYQEQIQDSLSFMHRLVNADRDGAFVRTLLDSREGRAVLARYLRSEKERKTKKK